jgi:predicted histone-like DNA-binding protein
MSVKFNVVERGNPLNPSAPKKFYPSVKSTGRVTTRQLAEVAARETALASGDLLSALDTILKTIPRELSEGNIVELGEFGTFWLRIDSDPSDSADDVRPEKITGTKPRFNPGKAFKKVLETIDFSKTAI